VCNPLNVAFVKCEDNSFKEFEENKALNFLVSLLTNYSADKWLCREHSKSTTYWIYNDNALAFQILSHIGNKTPQNSTLIDAAEKIRKTIEDKYNISILEGNDRIEVTFENQTITSPAYSGTGYHHSPIIDSDMQLGPNLVSNPSVEQGDPYPDWWYHSSWCNRTCWSSEQALTGNKSLKLVANSSSDDWRCQVFNVSPLKNYMFRCYLNGTVISGEWYLTIRWFNASEPKNEVFIFENNTRIGTGDYINWTQVIGFNFTAPTNAVVPDLLFRSINGTGTLYADDFEVREIISAGTYIVRNDVKHVQIPDWQDYADLLLFGVLDRYNRNDSSWMSLWENATKMFNGTGFIDKAFNATGKFDTYKLALFIITATTINQTQDIIFPQNYTKIEIFGKLQKPNGGVVTHYLQDFSPDPNATENIETTCLAIYACLSEEEIPIAWIPEFLTLLLVFMILLIVTIIMVAKKLSITSHDPVKEVKEKICRRIPKRKKEGECREPSYKILREEVKC
jgi:hypothetical protein